MPDPLTPEEVTALEHSSEGCTHENFYRALRTIRDRERERDDKEYARKEWAETAHRVIMERDELQRKLDELKESLHITIGARDNWKAAYDLALTNEVRWMKKHGEVTTKLEAYKKLAAPVREGQGGTE